MGEDKKMKKGENFGLVYDASDIYLFRHNQEDVLISKCIGEPLCSHDRKLYGFYSFNDEICEILTNKKVAKRASWVHDLCSYIL